jgi:hypothetical protein
VTESGLLCPHCHETLLPFDELPAEIQPALRDWGEKYAACHQVAHWDERQRQGAGNYDRALEEAAVTVEGLLVEAASRLAPGLLDYYAAALWEDQDECLEVAPEDVAV